MLVCVALIRLSISARFIARNRKYSRLAFKKRGGLSDANIVSAKGVTTLDVFGPFGDGDHTIHERDSKASFTRR